MPESDPTSGDQSLRSPVHGGAPGSANTGVDLRPPERTDELIAEERRLAEAREFERVHGFAMPPVDPDRIHETRYGDAFEVEAQRRAFERVRATLVADLVVAPAFTLRADDGSMLTTGDAVTREHFGDPGALGHLVHRGAVSGLPPGEARRRQGAGDETHVVTVDRLTTRHRGQLVRGWRVHARDFHVEGTPDLPAVEEWVVPVQHIVTSLPGRGLARIRVQHPPVQGTAGVDGEAVLARLEAEGKVRRLAAQHQGDDGETPELPRTAIGRAVRAATGGAKRKK